MIHPRAASASAFVLALFSCTSASAQVNRAPVVGPPDVYRTYPGFPIQYAIPADDPDGDDLTFATADLPAGSTVLIRNVPQYTVPPYYFGWGLQSALKKPFTSTDLATESLVVNPKNIQINDFDIEIPQEFDRRVELERDWRRPRLMGGQP